MKQDECSGRIRARLGYRIRLLREDRGLSQSDFAYRIGINRSYLSGVENGKRNLTVDILARMADILGVTLSELFEGVDAEDEAITLP